MQMGLGWLFDSTKKKCLTFDLLWNTMLSNVTFNLYAYQCCCHVYLPWRDGWHGEHEKYGDKKQVVEGGEAGQDVDEALLELDLSVIEDNDREAVTKETNNADHRHDESLDDILEMADLHVGFLIVLEAQIRLNAGRRKSPWYFWDWHNLDWLWLWICLYFYVSRDFVVR